MKKILVSVMTLLMSLSIAACTDHAEERMFKAQLKHERDMAMIQNGMNPDMHTGMRTTQAYHQPMYQGPSYLETMAIAAGAGYVVSKFVAPYEPSSRVTVINGTEKRQYFDKKGKVISAEEYGRRMRQSAKDKDIHRAKESKRLDAWKAQNKHKFKASEKKWAKENPKKAKARTKSLAEKSKAAAQKAKTSTALKAKNANTLKAKSNTAWNKPAAQKQSLQDKSKNAFKSKTVNKGNSNKLTAQSKSKMNKK